MGANARKSNLCSENQEAGLTIFDAPNAARDIMAKCQALMKHSDPEVVKLVGEIHDDAKRMLDAIMGSVEQILAVGT